MALTTTQRTDLIKVYLAAFNRAPDASGLDFWARSIDNGTHSTVTAVADAWFNDSTLTEVVAAYPSYLTNEEFVGRIYTNVFGRAADAEGLAFWSASLTNGANTKGSLLVNMFASLNNAGSEADLAVFNNKVAVSENFAITVGSNDLALAATILENVDGTAASVTAANATVNATANAGSTFTLTTGIDTVTGTSGNDAFVADESTGDAILSSADTISGGAGDDVLNAYTDGGVIAAAQLSSVETLNLYDLDDDQSTANNNMASLTTVNLIRGDGTPDITVGANVTTIGLTDIEAAAADLSVTLDADATSINLNASGLSGGTGDDVVFVGAGLTTVNANVLTDSTIGALNAAGASSVTINATGDLTLVDGVTTTHANATLTLTGAGAVDLSDLDTGVLNLNASANTGGMTVQIGNADDTVIVGSAGNDVITASTDGSVVAGDALSVDAGAGDADVLVNASGAISNATEGADYTNFEILRSGIDQDVSLISGITGLQVLAAAGGLTFSGLSAANAGAIEVRGNVGTDLTLTMDDATGSADVVSLDLKSTTATSNVTVAGLSVIGVETLNIAATTGTAATDSTVAFGNVDTDDLTSINVTGAADFAINTTNLDAVLTLDATALTGDFTVTGALAAGSVVTAGAGADTATIGAIGSTYTMGAGNDGVTTALAYLVADGTDDSAVNGGDGTDTLTISDNAVTLTDNHFTYVSGMEKLTLSHATLGATSITTGAGFNSAFADGVTVTAATHADGAAFSFASGLYAGGATIALTTAAVGDADAEDITIVTGAGDDSVTVDGSAAYVGHAATGSTISVTTGAGADTIVVKTDALLAHTGGTGTGPVIDAGEGADTITLTTTNGAVATAALGYVSIVIDSGDSTTSAYDTITGFDLATAALGSSHIEFAGVAAVGTLATTVDYGSILSHSITNGVATFDDAAAFSSALVIDSSNLDDVLGYLAGNTATNDVVAFTYDSDDSGTADATMVYHNYTVDSLVMLAGTTSVDKLMTAQAAGANDLFIS
jgi:hypothetical protein